MELIDSHCHIDVAEFDADRSEVLARCRAAGITRLVVPAIEAAGWDRLLSLCQQEQGLFPALGLHPVFIDRHRDEHIVQLEARLATTEVVAVGEIGLDFYIDDADRPRQKALFEAQLAIAENSGLPVILHVRKAHDEVLKLLRKFRLKGGVAHAFNGSLQQASSWASGGP
jgi:TatD DNase family protein